MRRSSRIAVPATRAVVSKPLSARAPAGGFAGNGGFVEYCCHGGPQAALSRQFIEFWSDLLQARLGSANYLRRRE
jgi:hypothetical protein